jgi:tetratricopeptide (TPR) repeat protein
MMILEFRLQGKDTVYKRIEKVDYIIGSGQHTNSHIQNVNGYLNQMPMTYYTQTQKWDLPPGFEQGFNTRFSRKIGLECMSCHNAFPDHVKGSENKYNALPEGINCERCHGPGSIHVQQRSTGSVVDTSRYIDYSIVNPGKLPIDRQFDVCQRCHLQGNTVLKEGKSFYDFKPGMVLSDYMSTFLPRYKNRDDEFIMASHADRLKQSKCFISTTGKISAEGKGAEGLRPYKNALTCVTCHDPHVSVEVTGTAIFNAACNNCHQPKRTNVLCSEKPSVRKLKQDNCVSCHMPKSGSTDIPHVTVHDHYIRKPVKKAKIEKIMEFIALESVNEPNPDRRTKAKAYLQQYDKFEYNPIFLDSASQLLSSSTKEDLQKNLELLVHLEFIRGDYNKITSYIAALGKDHVIKELLNSTSHDNAHAWTLYRIGESYYNTGDVNSAYACYHKAQQLSPFNPEFKNKLGVALMAQNKVKDAIPVLEGTVKENPRFVQALNNLGYAYLLDGRPERAQYVYNKALALDPDYIPLLMNVAGLYAYQQNYKSAEIYLKKVLAKDPKNVQAKAVLVQLKPYL